MLDRFNIFKNDLLKTVRTNYPINRDLVKDRFRAKYGDSWSVASYTFSESYLLEHELIELDNNVYKPVMKGVNHVYQS